MLWITSFNRCWISLLLLMLNAFLQARVVYFKTDSTILGTFQCSACSVGAPPTCTSSTTDEEMRQIEQPVECLIERTKHKCRRCTRFFSSEAALKQHHCEPQIKKEKCSHCSKTINCANNLEKHLRSCEKAPTHLSKRQLRHTTLDGPTSWENRPSTPKKLMVEEVQVGASGTC